MNSIKKHIIRKKLHMSKKQFENFENLINTARKILVPILISISLKMLLKASCNHKHKCHNKHDHCHCNDHHNHFNYDCSCHKHHHHHEECDCGCHDQQHYEKECRYSHKGHKHHHHHPCPIMPELKELLIKNSPKIVQALEQYKLNDPNNMVVNTILDLVKNMNK